MIEQTSAYIPADAAVSAPPAGLLLSYEQLAKEIGVAVPTLYEWVRKGRIPSPIYLGSIPRFTRAVAQQLLERGTDPDGTHEVRSSKRREAIIDGIAA
jgi:excisionase family DNA binding protein